jgi:DHA2 family multidrug resistance protein-like MFS transporter
MIVGAAPPEKAGSASAMSETSQELGLTLGFVIPGSLGAAVYRNQMAGAVPSGTPDARESLTGAVAAAEGLTGPLGTELLDSAREAFTAGLNATAGIGTAVFVVLTADALRHVPPTGETEQAEDALASAPKADHDPKEVSMQPSE